MAEAIPAQAGNASHHDTTPSSSLFLCLRLL